MNFLALVKSVKADFSKGDITLSFQVTMREGLEEAKRLAAYAGKDEDKSDVELAIPALHASFVAWVTTVRANLPKGRITLSFVTDLGEGQASAEELAEYVGKEDLVKLEVTPRQMALDLPGK
jgi:hypothetical protein